MGTRKQLKKGQVPKAPDQVDSKVKEAETGYIEGIERNRKDRHQSDEQPPKPPK